MCSRRASSRPERAAQQRAALGGARGNGQAACVFKVGGKQLVGMAAHPEQGEKREQVALACVRIGDLHVDRYACVWAVLGSDVKA